MKIIAYIALAAVLLSSCGRKKESNSAAARSEPEKKVAPAPVVVPQGKLPQMDAEKAKFIAAPSTPKDVGAKKVEKISGEIKKASKPVEAAKK